MTELSPTEEQTYIRKFAQRIIKERSGNYAPLKRSHDGRLIYPNASGIVSNRGNKLLQGSEAVTRNNLNSHSIKEEVVYYNGSEHKLLQRLHKRMKFFPEEPDKNNTDGDEIEEVDLNDLVDIREILTPIASLSDISKRQTVARTFNNSILQNLSLQTVLMVEKEQNSIIRYNRMLEVFLGDYPEPLYERNLKLKKYNHNLALPEEEENGNESANDTIEKLSRDSTPVTTTVEENADPNTTDNTVDNEHNEEGETSKAIIEQPDNGNDEESKSSTDMENDNDPFFALPQVKDIDGLDVLLKDLESTEAIEQMETTRQMAQIALQRNQEFIRNLKTIRNFMDKASRIRERILAWSKEYSGIQEDGVTVPTALKVVKRGLISATTNRSVGKKAETEEDNVA
ncbi:histone deacetylase complex subunit Rxt2 [Maudiozyma exigua]|uniref:Histone deacetylase complex subunit Rxt2 n=1 Tax=Maudiozyma exigua TaxID=34358 RepID=A0A9P7BBB5_MAUEX|nr:histone deacetylase complex subunit Rxt2 [Kazachstania exigua]